MRPKQPLVADKLRLAFERERGEWLMVAKTASPSCIRGPWWIHGGFKQTTKSTWNRRDEVISRKEKKEKKKLTLVDPSSYKVKTPWVAIVVVAGPSVLRSSKENDGQNSLSDGRFVGGWGSDVRVTRAQSVMGGG